METTKQPLITVVMPNYNGHRFVEQAIDSVLNQTYPNFELLVVDDCSKDNSLQLIQQKVALAKWLAANCQVIILDEPTRGVDVGAKSEIYSIINSLAQDGAAVIMISSEMEEIINMCDRAVVMRQGIVTGELDKKELNEQGLIALAMGVA